MKGNCQKDEKQNKKKGLTVPDLALCAVLLALAIVISFLEASLNLVPPVPGIKLGLANLVMVCALYILGGKYAVVISVARVFMVGIFSGQAQMIPYSLVGAMLSLVVMMLLKRVTKLSVVAVSCFGGICHNIGQLIVAMIVVENTSMVIYLPALLVAGFITGLAIGIVCRLILPAVRKSYNAVSRR